MITRRAVMLGSLALAGCATATAGPPSATEATRSRFAPAANPSWDAWVADYKPRAEARGVPRSVIDAAFAEAGYIPEVVRLDRNQAEFKRSFEDYLQLVASDERVFEGRAAYAANEAALRRAEARYGVPAEVVTAVWGVESRYGQRLDSMLPVVSATSTLAWEGRRGSYFESELTAALRILADGDVGPSAMVGSWAGAMGHTQFMPTVFRANAVDFDGDGRRDIWGADPTDALGGAANFLANIGWQRGQPYAAELGAPGAGSSGTRQPDAGGPVFGIGPNFRVLRGYNPSDNYALAVSYLAGRIAGAGPLRTPFGPDRYGFVLNERIELQRRLTAAGFDAGTPDGVFGRKTAAAIEGYETSRGLPVTGEPSRAILSDLRA